MASEQRSDSIIAAAGGQSVGGQFLTASVRETMTNWLHSQEMALKGAADMTKDALEFTQNQIHASWQTWEKIASCKSPDEAVGIHFEAFQHMSAECLGLAKKIGERTATALNGSVPGNGSAAAGTASASRAAPKRDHP